MRLAFVSKHVHFALAINEPEEEEAETMLSLGGDFEPADGHEHLVEIEEGELKFGFNPVAKVA